MIPRYSRPEAAAVWTEESKYNSWLTVELAVCDALAELGLIPESAAKDIREKHGDLKQSKDSFAVGDVLIYDKTSTNKYGHVCILVSLLDTNTFIVLEQNGFEQSGTKLTVRNTTNLLGSLYK